MFRLDLETCEGCGGQVRVIASSEHPGVIGRIRAQLVARDPAAGA